MINLRHLKVCPVWGPIRLTKHGLESGAFAPLRQEITYLYVGEGQRFSDLWFQDLFQ